MKLFVIAFFIGAAAAYKFDSTYLPPGNARTAGGNGNFLSTPVGGNAFRNQQAPGPVYGAPVAGYRAANPVYEQKNYGAPISPAQRSYYSTPVHIIRSNNQNNGDGTYQFDYETENKIVQHETGQLKNVGTNEESSVVHGSYSYASPDGQTITVDYVADENGFQPTGQHLPTPPPVPEAILKSLELNAAEEAAAGRTGYASGPAFNGQYQPQNNGQYQPQNNGQYQPNLVNRQYLTPNANNAQSGYRY